MFAELGRESEARFAIVVIVLILSGDLVTISVDSGGGRRTSIFDRNVNRSVEVQGVNLGGVARERGREEQFLALW